MVPLVKRIAEPYSITVLSSGGFDSTTAKYDLAQTLVQFERSEVLDISDHDQSGVHKYTSLAEDVQAFMRGMGAAAPARFTRLAVTLAQIAELSLPTAPPKVSDRRSFDGDVTTQVEAIPPDVLVEIISSAILSRLDVSAYEAVLAEEQRIKAQLSRILLPTLQQINEG
jgi:hypothetical protein